MTRAALSLALYAGVALLLGGVVARRWLTPGRPGPGWPLVAFFLLVLGALGRVGLTLWELGLGAPADALDYLTEVAAGRATLTLLLGACVLLAAEVGTLSWLAALGAGGVLLWGLAGSGHGNAHGDPVRLAHAAHAGAMALWLGGLAALRHSPDDAGAPRRFSRLAAACVVTLAASGTLMALSHAGPPLELPQTAYGRLLLLKLALVGASLLAALAVRRRLLAGRPGAFPLAAEVLLLVAALSVTAVLTGTPPPAHASAPGHSSH